MKIKKINEYNEKFETKEQKIKTFKELNKENTFQEDLKSKWKEMKELNETVNHEIVDDLMQKVRDRYTQEEITSMIDEQMLDYIDEDWDQDGEYDSEYDWYLEHGRNAAEYDVIQNIINSVSNGVISLDDNSELFNQIADEYGINID